MALHVPKAPGFAQMLKDGAKVSGLEGWCGGRADLSLRPRERPAGVRRAAVQDREGSRKGAVLRIAGC